MRLVLAFLLCASAHAAIDVPLRVRETAGVARAGEVIRSGIPIPRSAGILSTAGLAIVGPNGAAVPAQFRILARWNAGRSDTTKPVQWLLVSFPASVGPRATGTYRLVSGSNPAPATPLRVTRDGNRVVVDTGAATFTVDGASASLFEEIRFGGAPVVTGGSLTARIDGVDSTYSALRRLSVEEAGPLSAVVVIEGTYSASQVSSQRRYIFSAGSSTVTVTQTLAWEGTRCGAGEIRCGGAINALRVQQVRDTLKTTGATVAVALERMHRYGPQAVSTLEDGTIAIDIAADQVWLGARQALFATMAIGASAPAIAASLDHPLRAWPDASWFAASDAVDPFPAGAVAPEHAEYDTAVRQALDRTLAKRDELGIQGLMTFGLFPRIWGNPIYSDEIVCGDDPTPGESWDDLYWCTTWTDYHNTSYAAAARAMRTGEVEWLDEITRPAALRVLYTQMFQCAPDDGYFYCGQAPAGYGGYRADFNSSHAYFDNLQLYYWLTGDSAVVDALERGSRSMRDYLCTRRPSAPCQPHDPPVDEYANLTGRVASQWIGTFRFVGLASDNASYLDDYRNNLARGVTQQFVSRGNYGFVLGGWRPAATSGRVTTDQLWMTALYDMKNLDRLRRDTNDAPIGDPPRRPSEVIAAYARAIERYGPTLGWPNSFDVTFDGTALLSVEATPGGSDPFLYDTGRSTLAGPVATAATIDPSLRAFASELTRFAIEASIADGSPLGKLQGEYLARLHAAVAALAPPPPDGPRTSKRRSARH